MYNLQCVRESEVHTKERREGGAERERVIGRKSNTQRTGKKGREGEGEAEPQRERKNG